MKLFSSAKRHLNSVRNYQPGKPIEEVERECGIRGAIKMASNENALGPSPKALKAILASAKDIHRYPDGGCFYLRQALAKRLKVRPENLVFGNGSDEILSLSARAFVGPGDGVVIADPTFLIYEIATQVESGRVTKVPMKNYRYDLAGMLDKVTRATKLVFIANPDNPVGTYVTETELLNFMRRVPKEVVVILDEAYYEFAMGMPGYPKALKFFKNYPNLVIARTFSKIYGLAGLRIGYAIAHESVARALNKVREPFNVNLLAQKAALAALRDDAHLRKTLKLVATGRKYLSAEIKKMNLGLINTATNFILVDLKTEAKPVYERMLKMGVIVRPMGVWGLDSYIRVTIGKPAENKRFITALKETLNK